MMAMVMITMAPITILLIVRMQTRAICGRRSCDICRCISLVNGRPWLLSHFRFAPFADVGRRRRPQHRLRSPGEARQSPS